MEDIDHESLRAYRQNYANLNPTHAWNELDNQSFLKMIGGWRVNRETGQAGLTAASEVTSDYSKLIDDADFRLTGASCATPYVDLLGADDTATYYDRP